MNTMLTVRVDEKLKQEFNDIVHSLGLDAPTVIRMLIRQTVNRKAIPLSLSVKDGHAGSTMNFLDEVRADWGEW
ncbi:MAG: type II toxin-antitoxin system RelB/DinJ family antitoxin [Clostridiales Family XIII bacterium]|jgi:addiction module RelB/DinJ family antitoxin|nr:type II toxin-antitoxin system RelB/DinJ family antitoxin [Clostridiales Family XIII bacterium]